MHVGEIPDSELVIMLNKRCGVAESRAKMMVAVMRELQRRRKNANVLAGKYGFITPRDLFRWAERHRDAETSSMDSCAIAGIVLLPLPLLESASDCLCFMKGFVHFEDDAQESTVPLRPSK